MNLRIKKAFGIAALFFCMLALTAYLQSRLAETENVREDVLSASEECAETEHAFFGVEEKEKDRQDESSSETDKIKSILSAMTLEEKIAQMFIVTPEALTGCGTVASAGDVTKEAFWKRPVGGLIYFAGNIRSKEQVTEMTRMQQQFSMERMGLPLFISVDEEGGSVARIANDSPVVVPHFPDMAEIGAAEDAHEQAEEAGEGIGSYLAEMGFNLDFAPVADALTNPENTVVKRRSFGTDAYAVARLASAFSRSLEDQGVYSCRKHFPGHGATAEDSHEGFASTDKTLDELLESELIPFQEGIDAGASFLMAGHISAPNVTGDDLPATLSHVLLSDVLRGKLRFDGIIITDAMNMGAVVKRYGAGEAAELAVSAGADMILMPADFESAYQGLLEAVDTGRITEGRIDESLGRIIEKKLKLR